MEVDKRNGSCLYNDEAHVYWDENDKSRYISVTTLIGEYENYDKVFWSSYKALETYIDEKTWIPIKISLLRSQTFNKKLLKKFNIDKDEFENKRLEVIKSWEEKARPACERGTAIHLERELVYYTKPKHELKQFNLTGEFKCEKDHYELNYDKGVYPEYLISKKTKDGILRIAGQIDLLIKDGNEITIIDYKTNLKLDKVSYYNSYTKKYQMMKYPLHKLMDCNMMHYTLQLSLYAYLVQLINPDFVIKKLMIIHYDHDGKVTNYDIEYKKKEVELMLKNYKKKLLYKEHKAKNEPIVY